MKIPSITRWDAIVSDEFILFLDVDACPGGCAWNEKGIFIRRGDDIVHLAESEKAIERISGRSSIIVVEADERIYRITRIPCVKDGVWS